MAHQVTVAEEGLYDRAHRYSLEALRRTSAGEPPDVADGMRLLERMSDSLSRDTGLVRAAMDRSGEFQVGRHCANVCVIALRLAQTLKYNLERQLKIGTAALLHEVGVCRLPAGLLEQPRRLTQPEMEFMHRRPQLAAQVLRDVGVGYDWLVEPISQVYERENGAGHPKGLIGREISEEGKLLGLADAFEACLHERPYRRALTGYQSLFELTNEGVRSYSMVMLRTLLKTFTVYPYNEYVVLNTGGIGQVVEVNSENSARPVLRLLFSETGEPLPEPRIINLSENRGLYIIRAVTREALPQ